MLERLDTVICNNSGGRRNPFSPNKEDKIKTLGFSGKSHSEEAKQKMREAKLRNNPGAFKKGEKNSNWNGGISITEKGYTLILKPSHPYSNYYGYVKRSRLVMEEHLGRYLKPEETVHHENEIKDDDRIENLSLFNSGGEHTSFHGRKEQ